MVIQAEMLSPVLQGVKEVLSQCGRSMTAREIVSYGRRNALLNLHGKTPWKTVNARLSEHILEKKSKSVFIRTDSGRFALRQWADVQEYVAPRRTIALFDENILAFETARLREFVPENGMTTDDADHNALLSSCFSVRRREAEERYDIIQLVSVYVVRFSNRFLTYKRAKRLPEERLHYSYSCFFGGHLNEDDLMPLFRLSDPEQALFLLDRELSEELILDEPPSDMRFKGLLYDPKSEVSKQHLGVVFLVDLQSSQFQIGERGFLTDPRFERVSEMEERIDEFENWSQFLIQRELSRWN